MSDFKIEPLGDGTWDLVMEDGDFVMVGETAATWQDEVKQRVAYAVGTWYQESAFDRDQGFPWLEGVFGKQPLEGIAALVYDHIIAVEGVEGIDDAPVLSLDTETRILTITVDVRGEGFVVPVTVEIPGGIT